MILDTPQILLHRTSRCLLWNVIAITDVKEKEPCPFLELVNRRRFLPWNPQICYFLVDSRTTRNCAWLPNGKKRLGLLTTKCNLRTFPLFITSNCVSSRRNSLLPAPRAVSKEKWRGKNQPWKTVSLHLSNCSKRNVLSY